MRFSDGAKRETKSSAFVKNVATLLLVAFLFLGAALTIQSAISNSLPREAHIGMSLHQVMTDPRFEDGYYVVVEYSPGEVDVVDGPYDRYRCREMASAYFGQDKGRHRFGCVRKGTL